MRVRVVFTTQLRAALGRGGQELALAEGATVRSAIETLAAEHAAAFASLVLGEDQQPLPSIVLCVNDQQVAWDHAQPLQEGDTLTLLSAISGG